MGIAIYVCITFVRHNIIKSALQTIYDQQSARSTSSILNCSEASLSYGPLLTGGFRHFFLCPIQFLQADHFVLGMHAYAAFIILEKGEHVIGTEIIKNLNKHRVCDRSYDKKVIDNVQ